MLGFLWLRGFWFRPLPPSSRALCGLVLVLSCNAWGCRLRCIALHCCARPYRVTLGSSSGCVTSSHLVSCCSTCHQQACLVDVSGMKLGQGHVISCRDMSCQASCHVMSCHVMSRYVTSCPVISARVMFGLSSGILSRPFFPCHVTLSCHKRVAGSRRHTPKAFTIAWCFLL